MNLQKNKLEKSYNQDSTLRKYYHLLYYIVLSDNPKAFHFIFLFMLLFIQYYYAYYVYKQVLSLKNFF